MLVFVNVMWGLSFIFSKTALSEGMPPMTLAFLRYLITAGLMLPLCLKLEHGVRLYKWAPRAFATTLLGITVSAVKMRMKRGREALRSSWEGAE